MDVSSLGATSTVSQQLISTFSELISWTSAASKIAVSIHFSDIIHDLATEALNHGSTFVFVHSYQRLQFYKPMIDQNSDSKLFMNFEKWFLENHSQVKLWVFFCFFINYVDDSPAWNYGTWQWSRREFSCGSSCFIHSFNAPYFFKTFASHHSNCSHWREVGLGDFFQISIFFYFFLLNYLGPRIERRYLHNLANNSSRCYCSEIINLPGCIICRVFEAT